MNPVGITKGNTRLSIPFFVVVGWLPLVVLGLLVVLVVLVILVFLVVLVFLVILAVLVILVVP